MWRYRCGDFDVAILAHRNTAGHSVDSQDSIPLGTSQLPGMRPSIPGIESIGE
jgi:hypothetical protein